MYLCYLPKPIRIIALLLIYSVGLLSIIATGGGNGKGSLQVNIVSPDTDAWLRGSIEISADVTGGTADNVNFFIDDTLVGSDNTTPYQINYDTRLLSDGSHLLRVVASSSSADPGSAQSGFNTDNTAPGILSLSPANNATNVIQGITVNVEFTEAIDIQTITASSFIVATGAPVSGSIIYDEATRIASFSPNAPFPLGATVTVTLNATILDQVGNNLPETFAQFSIESLPVIEQLSIMNTEVSLAVGGNEYNQAMAVKYLDPDLDIETIKIGLTYPDGSNVARDVAIAQSAETGVYMDILYINSEYPAGDYVFNANLVDSHGHESGVQTVAFTISESAIPPVAISSIAPDNGKPGDEIVIHGHGFDADEPERNVVSFSRIPSLAEVVQASEDSITVIVPQGATTGPIRVENYNGRAESSVPFSVVPMIHLSPTRQKLVVGHGMMFDCLPSGTATARVNWLINGQAQPDISLGSIDGLGNYLAPATVPTPSVLTVRCESVDNAGLFAEAELEIIEPIAPRDQTVIRSATGGIVQSRDNTVQLNIPPNALAEDTVIQLRDLPLAAYSSGENDSYLMALGQFQPAGLQFSQPVTVEFQLKHWLSPGSTLKLMQLNESTGEFDDTGEFVIVDDTGRRGLGQINHFSIIGAFRELALVEEQLDKQKERLEGRPFDLWGNYRYQLPDGLQFLEALDVPLYIHLPGGSDGSLGPFAHGISVTVEMEGNSGQNLLQAGPPVEVSADGWELGTILRWNVTSLPDCHAGQSREAVLKVTYPATDGAEQVALGAPLTIRCLDELNFSRGNPPTPEDLPDGAWMQIDDDEPKVRLPTDQNYEFSEIVVGEGATLSIVSNDEDGNEIPPNPYNVANVLVTGRVVIDGQLLSVGYPGENGGEGGIEIPGVEDEYTGGLGGKGGFHWSGDGGRGGPWEKYLYEEECERFREAIDEATYGFGGFLEEALFSESDCPGYYEINSGARGLTSPAPGLVLGGRGGDVWNAPGPVTILFDLLMLAKDIATAAVNPSSIVAIAKDVYYVGEDAVKVINAEENKAKSAGRGGQSGKTKIDPELAYFIIPEGGAGGGGAGEMMFKVESNNAGGGGGGGGGGAPGLLLSVDGDITIGADAYISGRGGNGGLGGVGESYWIVDLDGGYLMGPAAPGGGGGGGSGAQIVMIGKEVRNSGEITLRKGITGFGVFKSEDDDQVAIVPQTIGSNGQNGVLRVNAKYPGIEPTEGEFHKGPRLGEKLYLSGFSNCYALYLGEARQYPFSTFNAYYYFRGVVDGEPLDLREAIIPIPGHPEHRDPVTALCYGTLSEGMHTLSVEVSHEFEPRPGDDKGSFVGLTPIERKTIFVFPGQADADADGLMDATEEFLGTDPDNPDTDGDGYSDSLEVFTLGTDPLVADRYLLAINAKPVVGGSYTVNPAGNYQPPDTSVTLTATPNPDYLFYRWSGDLTTSTNPIVLTMDGHKNVTAQFMFTNYFTPIGSWQGPLSLSIPTTINLSGPRIDMQGSGDAAVTWRYNDQVAVRRYDATALWEAVDTFGTAQSGKPYIDSNINGDLVVAWDNWDEVNSVWEIFVRRYSPDSGWYDIEQMPGTSANTAEPPQPTVALNGNGDIIVVWKGDDIYARRYTESGGWQVNNTFLSGEGTDHRIKIDSTGRAVAIWTLNDHIYASVFSGAQWQTAARISEAAAANQKPRIVLNDNGVATVVWHAGNDVYSYSFNYTTTTIDTTGPRIIIDNSDMPADSVHPVIDQYNNITVIWQQGDDIWANRYVSDFDLWLDAMQIENLAAPANAQQLRIDGHGNAMAIWMQDGEVNSSRFLAAQGWTSTAWTAVEGIATPPAGFQISAPRLDLDNAGNAIVVWKEWNSDNNTGRINSRRFSVDAVDSDGDGLNDVDEVNIYGTDPSNPDTDDDGLLDGAEVTAHLTDPLNSDSDADGLTDGAEVNTHTSDPNNPDTDGDSLTDGDEVNIHGTSPLLADTDGDGLLDDAEVNTHLTDPLNSDSDADGLSDGDEVNTHNSNPNNADTDSDGLIDGDEVNIHGTNLVVADTDNDGLQDGDEITTYLTDPLNSDSDADGLTDGAEVNTHASDPNNADTDGDSLVDGDEVNVYGTNPLLADTDSDGLLDGSEVTTHLTDPLNSDTDGDGLTDGAEVNTHSSDPNNSDTDGDSLADGDEVNVHGTNPTLADTDGDNFADNVELDQGTDPLDPSSYPDINTTALYPSNGGNWNDYISNNGATQFTASDMACSWVGFLPRSVCLHAGQYRVMEINWRNSCDGLSATDVLGAFNWLCDDSTGVARMISTGLREGKYLSDLIDWTVNPPVWIPNTVLVENNGMQYAASETSVWWGNPIEVDNDGGSLATEGTIYVVTTNADASYTLDADRIGFVIQPGMILRNSVSVGTGMIYALQQYYMWLEGDIDATGNWAGMQLAWVHSLVLSNVKVANADVTDISFEGNSSGNLLKDIVLSNSMNGLRVELWSLVDGLTSTNMSNIAIAPGINTTLIDITASNSMAGITNGYASGSIVYNLTSTNNASAGVSSGRAGNIDIVNAAIVNNNVGITVNQSSARNSFINTVVTENTTGIMLQTFTIADYFSGLLKVGNDVTDCFIDPTSLIPSGLQDITCANDADSDAILTWDVSGIDSFVGRVVTDDLVNNSDVNGVALFDNITDWLGFENQYRGWGNNGLSVDDISSRWQCSGELTCRIWDWSLANGDTGDHGSPVLLNVLSLPTGNDTLTHVWDISSSAGCDAIPFAQWNDVGSTCESVVLRNAVEILDDGIGNENGLCESDETCLFTPNVGSYQGHGNLIPAGTFVDGIISGVTLLRYESNGY